LNNYSSSLKNALYEIDDFSKTQYGKQWESTWYSTIKAYVQKTVEAKSNEEAEECLGIILYMLTDSGPITVEMSKSLGLILQRIQTKKKR